MRLPIVYVSHSVEEVARLADTLVLLADGRVVASGTRQRRLRPPRPSPPTPGASRRARCSPRASSRTTRRAAPRRSTIRRDACRCRCSTGRRAASVRLRVRARDVALAVGEPGLISIRNRLPATVAEIADRPRRRGRGAASTSAAQPLVARITRDAARALEHRSRPAGRGADQVGGIRPAGRFWLRIRCSR